MGELEYEEDGIEISSFAMPCPVEGIADSAVK